eukprot:s5550_g1.t1
MNIHEDQSLVVHVVDLGLLTEGMCEGSPEHHPEGVKKRRLADRAIRKKKEIVAYYVDPFGSTWEALWASLTSGLPSVVGFASKT